MRLKILLALLASFVVIGLPLLYARETNERIRNFREVVPGQLYRSGQMSAAGLIRTLDEYHIGTVISFRDERVGDKPAPDEHEETLCKSLGVHYHRLSPMRWSAPDGTVPAQANVDKFLTIVRDPRTPRPILVHCFAGVHRTGAFVALYRIDKCGWINAEALEEMLAIGGDRKTFDEDQLDYIRSYKRKQ